VSALIVRSVCLKAVVVKEQGPGSSSSSSSTGTWST
jgi:hypothetical protein